MSDTTPDTFEQYVCWDEQSVGKLMDTEADYIPEHVFAAVHHPMKMYRRELISASGSGQRVLTKQKAFLESFMDPSEDFRFVPVLGKSGTGKSHLVRWMNTRIEESEGRRVILIPKTGTNLRGVLHLILDEVEGDPFEEYRQRLGETATPVSDEEGQAQLLSALALSVKFNSEEIVAQRAKDADRQRKQFYKYTAERLHHLLDDPYFKEHWLREGGVIERIYDITLGASEERERLEEQRQFSQEDLPLDVSAIGDASQAARSFYTQLNAQPGIQEAALDILNDGLDYAIPKVLNFSGEDLLQLMLDVRASLAEREIELVLLIEDFAKLQGIHRQLLEALLERPKRPDSKPLCAMRTALACTDAYYATLEDTVQTRASFRVDLNLSHWEALGKSSEASFAARYLNAARLGEERVKAWYERREEGDDPPSACEPCPFQEECHDAFGAHDGIGLYPFNETALRGMYARTEAEEFNPRHLIKDVLSNILRQYTDDLRRGRFPSKTLHEEQGKDPVVMDLLNDLREPEEQARQRLALIDIWAGEDKLVNFHPAVHRAFGVDMLDLEEVDDKEEEDGRQDDDNRDGDDHDEECDRLPPSLREDLENVNNWMAGEEMLDQGTAQALREHLYGAVTARIDWDREGLLQSAFCSRTSSAPFRQSYIYFEDQQTKVREREVRLLIPLELQDRPQVARALRGLLLRVHHGGWNFTGPHGRDGDEYFRTYAHCLEAWAGHVVHQIRCPLGANKPWNPVPAVVEMMSTGARMGGHPLKSHTSLEDKINALFYDLAQAMPEEPVSQEWKRLFEQFQTRYSSTSKVKPGLLNLLEAFALCAKGSSSRTSFFDATQFTGVLEAWGRRGWYPTASMPDLPSFYDTLKTVRERYENTLERTLQSERTLFREWRAKVEKNIEGETPEEISEAVNGALEAAMETATSPDRRLRENVEEAVRSFKSADFKFAWDTAERVCAEDIEAQENHGRLVGELGWANRRAMRTTEALIDEVQRFFDRWEKRLNREISHLGGLSDENDALTQIEGYMDRLIADLETLDTGSESSVHGTDDYREQEDGAPAGIGETAGRERTRQ